MATSAWVLLLVVARKPGRNWENTITSQVLVRSGWWGPKWKRYRTPKHNLDIVFHNLEMVGGRVFRVPAFRDCLCSKTKQMRQMRACPAFRPETTQKTQRRLSVYLTQTRAKARCKKRRRMRGYWDTLVVISVSQIAAKNLINDKKIWDARQRSE